MSEPLTPERRAALRARAEAALPPPDPAALNQSLSFFERRMSPEDLEAVVRESLAYEDEADLAPAIRAWTADILDLLAALETAEAERDKARGVLQRVVSLALALAALPTLPSRNYPEWSRSDERERAKESGRLIAEAARDAVRAEEPPRPSRAEIEAVAGRYRDALPSVEEHLVDKHAEMNGPRLLQAIRDALEAAEAEGIDRYRGTDEPREFVRILRRAVGGGESG